MSRDRFCQHLLSVNLVREDQLRTALKIQQKKPHLKLGQILCDQGFLEENDLLRVLSSYSGIPVFPGSPHPMKEIKIDSHTVKTHGSCPFYKDEAGLHVAMMDPENLLLIDQLQRHYHTKIIPYHIAQKLLDELLEFYEHSSGTMPSHESVIDFEAITIKALREGASDIHCQPTENTIAIRYRIDGLLRTAYDLPKEQWPTLRTHIKVLASMDVAEERSPQSGRFKKSFAGRTIDFRVSSHPTVYGENIVIRILDKKKSLLSLDALGFNDYHKEQLRQCIQHNHGLILFTGPTGSGKTTSLYALLAEMDAQTRNIMTLEQPIEYAITGIRQSEITNQMTFAQGVRSLLRQDPDVILIGEIRDEDTAKMALRAAMTGHLVLSTLHTHDVFSATHRLVNLGISADLLADHLLCMVSQRLVRTVCGLCNGTGCDTCQHSGFKGRTCLSQCFVLDDTTRDLIASNASTRLLKKAHPFTLWDDGLLKIQKNITTKEEVTRVLGPLPAKEKV